MIRFSLSILCFQILLNGLFSQDAMFYEPNQIKGFLNPALTGIYGSLSATVTAKEQYFNSTNDFTTAGVSLEYSLPCPRTDFGIFYINDVEGAAHLRTHHVGGSFVYTIPFELNEYMHNIRIGTKFQYTGKSIDWDRLIFSDQIDPKYNLLNSLGIRNLTAFEAPEINNRHRITIGLGIIHRMSLGRTNPWALTWGLAVDNYTNLFEGSSYDSLLGLEYNDSRIVNKWSFYLSPEIPIVNYKSRYYGLRPSLAYLSEVNLSNLQMGLEFNFQRAYGGGIYLGLANFKDIGRDTKTITYHGFLKILDTKDAQLNLGLQYIHNIGGLSEAFGQNIQVTLRYHIKYKGCSPVKIPGSTRCESFYQSGHVLYENIWFE